MKETITKVLEPQWDTVTDQLTIDNKKFDNSMTSTTKRQILTIIALLFDPHGYLVPATMKMRLSVQNLWIQEKGWDDQLENKDIKAWQKIIAEMKKLYTISIRTANSR